MTAGSPLREQLAMLGPEQVRDLLAGLGPEQLQALRFDWNVWARQSQISPAEPWDTWLILSGRGWGKTRVGCEMVRAWAKVPGTRIAVVGRTSADCRDTLVEGESGILACCPPDDRPLYEPSKRRVTWRNGSQATTYSADEPDVLRGPQHHKALADELASWEYAQEAWDNLAFGLRLGVHPQTVICTTPRPIEILRKLMKDPTCRVTRGSTFENSALPESRLRAYRDRYDGTRTGRQELGGELLDDVPGALWSRALLDAGRVRPDAVPELRRVVVAVDPAISTGEGSNETGIVVCGRAANGHIFVIADHSGRFSPDGWARRAIAALDEFEGDRIVIEKNQGGAMCEATLRTVRKSAPIRSVHASRGKQTRAEPVSALSEQLKLHIVGSLPELEDQLCGWDPGGNEASPDRLDAMVWGATELMRGGAGSLERLQVLAGQKPPTADTLPLHERGALHGGSYVTAQEDLPSGEPAPTYRSTELALRGRR